MVDRQHILSLDMTLPRLGFGAMRLPKTEGGEIDFEAGRAMVDMAMAAGVNYFDTAYPYHEGKSEGFLREALKTYPRESYFLADKFPHWNLEEEGDVARIFEEQLERCGTGYFDFYLVHSLGRKSFEKVVRFGVPEYLLEKKRAGVIRRLGFSFHEVAGEIAPILDAYPWDFVQMQINYLDWELQDAAATYAMLRARNMPLMVMEPIRGGYLAAPPESIRQLFQAAVPGSSPAQWALRWAGSLEGVAVVLSGMSEAGQMRENIETFTGFRPVTDAERPLFAQALEAYRGLGSVPCTACRYCMDCPSGVDIPAVFAAFNDYKMNEKGNSFNASFAYFTALPEERRADRCTSCMVCVEKCPQRIEIPERLRAADEAFRALR